MRFSEIYFWLPLAKRDVLALAGDRVEGRGAPDVHRLQSADLTREDYEFYRSIRQRRFFAGDLYEHVSEAELAAHDMVVMVLQREFGISEDGYWRKGVPLPVRRKCQDRREEDNEPCESPFQDTTLIELSEIIAKNWELFRSILPKEYEADRRRLDKDFARLNWIRNAVMHPVKRRRWSEGSSEGDFEFARRMRETFQPFRAG